MVRYRDVDILLDGLKVESYLGRCAYQRRAWHRYQREYGDYCDCDECCEELGEHSEDPEEEFEEGDGVDQ